MNMNMNMIYKKSTFIIIFKNAHLGGRVVLSYERLMGMCRWMGSHFHNWIDYNGVTHFQIFGVRKLIVLHIYS